MDNKKERVFKALAIYFDGLYYSDTTRRKMADYIKSLPLRLAGPGLGAHLFRQPVNGRLHTAFSMRNI